MNRGVHYYRLTLDDERGSGQVDAEHLATSLALVSAHGIQTLSISLLLAAFCSPQHRPMSL